MVPTSCEPPGMDANTSRFLLTEELQRDVASHSEMFVRTRESSSRKSTPCRLFSIPQWFLTASAQLFTAENESRKERVSRRVSCPIRRFARIIPLPRNPSHVFSGSRCERIPPSRMVPSSLISSRPWPFSTRRSDAHGRSRKPSFSAIAPVAFTSSYWFPWFSVRTSTSSPSCSTI